MQFTTILSAALLGAVSATNVKMVLDDDIIAKVNSDPSATWVAGRNEYFEGMSFMDASSLLNVDLSGLEKFDKIKHTTNTAPDSYDPRADASRKSCTGPVLDQGFCGSCWAFGATEAISDRLCMSKGDNATYVQLSPLDMTACNSGFFSGENGCHGGQLGGAWNYAKHTGLVTEKCYPYLKSAGGPIPTCKPEDQPCMPESKFVDTPDCAKKCSDGSDWSSQKQKLSTTYSVDADQLKEELHKNGPVEGAFMVYSDFVHYKSGVYKHTTGSLLGGHAIKIIGYGTDASGTDYWLVQNSWTTTWGDGGYFKIAHGEVGIDEQCVAGSF